MFLCTLNEQKKDELVKRGFTLICKQNQGENTLYTFELKPMLFALFTEEDKKDILITNTMLMA